MSNPRGKLCYLPNTTANPKCEGTACYVKGAAALLTELQKELGIQVDQTTDDLLFTLKQVRCVGSCGLAPVVRVDEETFGRLTFHDLAEILAKYR